jgi:hypothetical protein
MLLRWQKRSQSVENSRHRELARALFRVLAEIVIDRGRSGEGGDAARDRYVVRWAIFGGEHGLL